jgi:hypothetical protein
MGFVDESVTFHVSVLIPVPIILFKNVLTFTMEFLVVCRREGEAIILYGAQNLNLKFLKTSVFTPNLSPAKQTGLCSFRVDESSWYRWCR